MIPYHNNFLISFHSPRNELSKKGKRRIGNNDIRFITQGFHLIAAKIAVTFKIMPFQIINIYNT